MKLKSGFYDYNPVISKQEDVMYTFDEYLNADESPFLSEQQIYEYI